jgi:hypothetical protein
VGRGDDPHVDGLVALATDRPNGPFLEHPEQLGLSRERQVTVDIASTCGSGL